MARGSRWLSCFCKWEARHGHESGRQNSDRHRAAALGCRGGCERRISWDYPRCATRRDSVGVAAVIDWFEIRDCIAVKHACYEAHNFIPPRTVEPGSAGLDT